MRELPAWYDIVSRIAMLSPLCVSKQPSDFDRNVQPSWQDIESGNNDLDGITRARDYFVELINNEVRSGVPESSIFLGMFSVP